MAADSTEDVRAVLQAHGVQHVDVPLSRAGLDPRHDVRSFASLARVLRSLRPDVQLAYTIKPVIYGTLAGTLVGVPRRYTMITGLGYAFLGSGWRRRTVRTVATSLYRVALTNAHGLFVQNDDDRTDLLAAGALPAKLPITRVRGSGVDIAHYRQVPLPEGPVRLLFVGRLLREKGVLAFVELARRVRARRPDVTFTIVGGIDPNPTSVSRDEVARWVGAGIVEYAGEVADVRPYIARSHGLVLPSDREGTPRSVLEAMSTGRPVIVSDVPGCRDTIVDGEQGFVVPHGDPDALHAAALRLVDDAPLRARMGNAARKRVCDLYDARVIAQQMIDVMGL